MRCYNYKRSCHELKEFSGKCVHFIFILVIMKKVIFLQLTHQLIMTGVFMLLLKGAKTTDHSTTCLASVEPPIPRHSPHRHQPPRQEWQLLAQPLPPQIILEHNRIQLNQRSHPPPAEAVVAVIYSCLKAGQHRGRARLGSTGTTRDPPRPRPLNSRRRRQLRRYQLLPFSGTTKFQNKFLNIT